MTNTTDDTDPTDEPRRPYDQPSPADTVVETADGPIILRMGHPPIPVGCGATSPDDLRTDDE